MVAKLPLPSNEREGSHSGSNEKAAHRLIHLDARLPATTFPALTVRHWSSETASQAPVERCLLFYQLPWSWSLITALEQQLEQIFFRTPRKKRLKPPLQPGRACRLIPEGEGGRPCPQQEKRPCSLGQKWRSRMHSEFPCSPSTLQPLLALSPGSLTTSVSPHTLVLGNQFLLPCPVSGHGLFLGASLGIELSLQDILKFTQNQKRAYEHPPLCTFYILALPIITLGSIGFFILFYFFWNYFEVNSDIMLFSSLLYRPLEAHPLLWCHHALMLTCYTMKNSHSNKPKGLQIPSYSSFDCGVW